MKFGVSHGYIVTAEDDGSIGLNAKIVAKLEMKDYDDKLLTTLIEQANLFHALMPEREASR